MIIAADLYATDLMHVEINTFFAEVFQKKLGQEIHLFAERNHLEAISRSVPIARGYAYNSFGRIARFRLLRVPFRELLTVLRSIRIVHHARKHCPVLLHIFCASHLSHLTLRLVFRMFPPNCPILLTFHGELESLAQTRRRPWSPFFWLPLSLKIRVNGLFPIVLGEGIRREVARRNYDTSNWITIEHPYAFSAQEVVYRNEGHAFLAGCIGVANRQKGTDLLFSVAEGFREDVASGRIRFRIIGKMDSTLRGEANEYVEIPRHGEFFDRGQYDRDISELDVILFFFREGTYQLTPSGSLFDAIRHNKPIIAMGNPYFRHIQRLVPGEVMTLVESLDEMKQVLRKWQEDGPPEHIYTAYESIRRIHGCNQVAKEFLRQLGEKIQIRGHLEASLPSANGSPR
jgi:DNA-binding phage protein